jgi:SAM-dependent methyltransferase
MLTTVAPPYSSRRLLLQLAQHGVRQPGRIKYRVNRSNLAAWWRYRRTEMRCNLCGHLGTMLYEMPDLELFGHHRIDVLRETLRCAGCHSKMRDRTIAFGLLTVLNRRLGTAVETLAELAPLLPPDLRVLDTDAHSRFGKSLRSAAGYVSSLYLPDRENGATLDANGTVNVNLEDMPFPDDSFDIIITSEVMEHVRYVDTAHREIARCLRPGGTYLFTVPYDAGLSQTLRLIDPVSDRHLVDRPHIHGDPQLRRKGIKSYRVFGRDIVDHLRRAGLEASFTVVREPGTGIFDGDLFLAGHAPSRTTSGPTGESARSAGR